MALNVSAYSIRKPIPSIILFIVLMLLGWISFRSLPISLFPNVDVPFIAVTVTQSGAAPAELETQVSKKIEDAIAGVSGIKRITSKVADGASTTTIEFRLEVSSDRALNDVKDAIAKVRADLPRTIDEPIVSRIDIAGMPIMTYAARAPQMTPDQLSWFVDDVVLRDLQSAKGVGSVARIGGIDREIRIALDPDRLNSFGVTASEVNRQLRATQVNLAGGRGEIGGREQTIRTLAGAPSLDDLAATMIALPGGRKVRLDELGRVIDGSAEARTFARLNGDPVVAFNISRAKGASDVGVAKAVEERVQQLGKRHPEVKIELIDTQVTYTRGNYNSAIDTLLEGAALAVIVVFIFLRDWRATLIAAVALPLSIIPTFWAMEMLGFSMNLISLLAITLVTGILVDDAIVEVENIVRHMHMGKSPYKASIEAADEIGLAVVATTLTIAAIFAPVSFMGGIAGQYFKQFGLVVAISVLFSLLVARLITPMLAAYFMREHEEKERPEGTLMRLYTRLVSWTTRHRFLTVGIGLFLFFASIFAMRLLPSGFIPAEDAARFIIVTELAPGARLSDTRGKIDEMTKVIRQHPEVASVFADGGRYPNGGRDIRKATLNITLSHKSERKKTQKQLEQEIFNDLQSIPDIRFWRVNDNGFRGLQMLIVGTDTEQISEVARQLASDMKKIPILEGPTTTVALDRPELLIIPRTERAADMGVSTDAIADTVRVATMGDVGPNLAQLDIGGRRVPIRVMLVEEAREDQSVLESLKVPSTRGMSVPLASVADISYAQGPASIDRDSRQRKIAVEADLRGTDALGEAILAMCKTPTGRKLGGECATQLKAAGITVPESERLPGVEIHSFGDAEVMQDVMSGFIYAMSVGLMLVFTVLVLLFASFVHPITILFSLPLAFGGVVIALLVTGRPMSMPVVIGLLMLLGIVTKNAILLVDFAIELVHKGISREAAIVDAGRKRARPIIMTTIAMAAGMMPSALGFGDGGEFRSPMAIAVIGGLLMSTLLSLLFVPGVFLVMDDIAILFTRIFGRFVGPKDEENVDLTHAPPRARPQHDVKVAKSLGLAAE